MRTRINPTPDQLERAREWLAEPLPVDEEASEQVERDILAIVGHRPRRALAEETEAEAVE